VDIEKQFAMSTHFLPSTRGETLFDAIKLVHQAGFSGFELVPADYQGNMGFPYTKLNVGLWPRDFSSSQRKELKDALKVFDFVTLHVHLIGSNIAGINPGLREESVRQYIECIELATDLNIKIVTFHAGGATRGVMTDPEIIIQHNINFGKKAVSYAEKYDLLMGYEVAGTGHYERLKREIQGVDHPSFGINYDMGHAHWAYPEDPSIFLDDFKDRIIEVHVNSVNRQYFGDNEHQPIERNNVLDYHKIFGKLKVQRYKGPYILELQAIDIPKAIDVCLRAREFICKLYREIR